MTTHDYADASPVQGELPCLTLEGRLIMGRPDSLSRAPDGSGGLYSALAEYAVPKHANEVFNRALRADVIGWDTWRMTMLKVRRDGICWKP